MPVRVYAYKKNEYDKLGLEVRVADQRATLADLLEVWEPLADDPGVSKRYVTENGSCRGCRNNCCNSAYVTPDLVSFKKMCWSTGDEPQQFLNRFFEPESLSNGVLRLKSGPCIFLQDNICSIYKDRSLVCRFYLCTEIEGETEELIYSAVTAGIAATYIWLEDLGLIKMGPGRTGFDRVLQELVQRYWHHPGTGAFLKAKNYHDIQLSLFP